DVPNLPEPLRDTQPRAARPDDDEAIPLREAVAALEKRLIMRALERANGNRSEAARQLGIGRPQLYAKLEEYGLTDRNSDDKQRTDCTIERKKEAPRSVELHMMRLLALLCVAEAAHVTLCGKTRCRTRSRSRTLHHVSASL